MNHNHAMQDVQHHFYLTSIGLFVLAMIPLLTTNTDATFENWFFNKLLFQFFVMKKWADYLISSKL